MTLGINILKCNGENILLKQKFFRYYISFKKCRQNCEIIPQSLGIFFLRPHLSHCPFLSGKFMFNTSKKGRELYGKNYIYWNNWGYHFCHIFEHQSPISMSFLIIWRKTVNLALIYKPHINFRIWCGCTTRSQWANTVINEITNSSPAVKPGISFSQKYRNRKVFYPQEPPKISFWPSLGLEPTHHLLLPCPWEFPQLPPKTCCRSPGTPSTAFSMVYHKKWDFTQLFTC